MARRSQTLATHAANAATAWNKYEYYSTMPKQAARAREWLGKARQHCEHGFASLREVARARQARQRALAAAEAAPIRKTPIAMFKPREVAQFGVSARPQMSCRTPRGTAALALAIIEARTPEEREAAQRAAEAALNYRLA